MMIAIATEQPSAQQADERRGLYDRCERRIDHLRILHVRTVACPVNRIINNPLIR